ncbi:SPW repeat domain-containing protein [Peristeroidobacter agariperforans]|uniref:SPW repeat domain-containing protein n=1 Tax=Peristeroidobacter agariperforans TaxID=268404 RepID=UPI0018E59AC5|nr:SPW repeat protein [Peristeroidobacter agariperforans]
MTTRRWIEWVNVLLGLWVIAAPIVLTSTQADGLAAWNSWSVGVGMVALAAFAMYKPSLSADAIGVGLGLWLVVSPWLLGFAAELPGAAINGVIVGLLVICYAFWAMRIDATFTVRAAA